MAHALPPQPGRRRNISIGAVLVIVVVAALAVAGWTLKNKLDRRSSAASTASTTTGPASATPTTTSAPTATTPATTPAPTTSAAPGKTKPSTTAPATTAPAKTSATPHTTSPTTTSPTRVPRTPMVALIVDNNTGHDGLAADAQARFEAKGWEVTSVGNFSGDVLSTCAYYDPDDPGSLAAAKALRAEFPAIHRIKPRFSRLPVAPIVVVLTTDYH